MEALYFACVVVLVLAGENSGYETQPVDAILFVDGAPTYLRMTNSTSLENVYACVLENSKNVNSVVMGTQMKGVILDVGQVEENVNEIIRRLSTNAARSGQGLWKSPEELKLLKTRMARYLSMDYYDNWVDPEAYLNYKFQRSTDWLHGGRGQARVYSRWGEPSYATPEPRRQYPSEQHATTSSPYFAATTTSNTPSVSVSQTDFPATTQNASSQPITVETTPDLNPSPKPFSAGGYVKIEPAIQIKVPDVATVLGDVPQNTETSNYTVANSEEKTPKNVTEYSTAPFRSVNETEIFGQTKEEDWSSGRSSEESDWEEDEKLKKRKKGKKKNPKKKAIKEKKKRRLVLDGQD